MKQLLTPKQVARALSVSESSVKRWCDKGVIPTEYTPGGHRRIAIADMLHYLRASKHELVSPEVLGLPATTGQTDRVIGRAARQMAEALLEGEEQKCRQIFFDLYLAGHRVSVIGDLVIAKAFLEIGDRWECGDAEVFQERRGCEIIGGVLHELRSALRPPSSRQPLALGAAIHGDHYSLPTMLVELVLREQHWQAISLGNNLPFETLQAAISEHHPRLFWLSVSHIADEAAFLEQYRGFYDSVQSSVPVVVGGRSLTESIRQQIKYAAFCDNLQHLESFAEALGDRGAVGP